MNRKTELIVYESTDQDTDTTNYVSVCLSVIPIRILLHQGYGYTDPFDHVVSVLRNKDTVRSKWKFHASLML